MWPTEASASHLVVICEWSLGAWHGANDGIQRCGHYEVFQTRQSPGVAPCSGFLGGKPFLMTNLACNIAGDLGSVSCFMENLWICNFTMIYNLITKITWIFKACCIFQ